MNATGRRRYTSANHLTFPAPPRFGFCLSLGFASWAASEGAEGPISEYNSREIPSGFLVDGPGAFFVGRGLEDGPGRDKILRTSAALAAIGLESWPAVKRQSLRVAVTVKNVDADTDTCGLDVRVKDHDTAWTRHQLRDCTLNQNHDNAQYTKVGP